MYEQKTLIAVMKKNINYKLLLASWLFLTPIVSFAEYFNYNSSYGVCFTPGSNCAEEIIKTLMTAKQQILVQAYSFTDIDIAKALVKAKARGVDVRVILDKSQVKGRYSLIPFLSRNKINVFIDHRPSIAHNKIMIVDSMTVISGSYNYTKSAARRNTENVVIIKDTEFAQKFVKNWKTRRELSVLAD